MLRADQGCKKYRGTLPKMRKHKVMKACGKFICMMGGGGEFMIL